MKKLLFAILMAVPLVHVAGQYKFEYTSISQVSDIILDVYEKSDQLYCLQVELTPTLQSSLLLLNPEGELMEQHLVGGKNLNLMRILRVTEDHVYFLGVQRADTCSSTVCILSFDKNTLETQWISTYPFCTYNIQNLRVVPAFDGKMIIQGYSVFGVVNFFIMEADSLFALTFLMNQPTDDIVSIDFSRKGYVIKDEALCNFYDRDFNYIKQVYRRFFGGSAFHQTHVPFSENLILEHFGNANGLENPEGSYIRLVDSNLTVKKQLIIPPIGDHAFAVDPPFFGGLDYLTEDHIWMSANFDLTTFPNIDPYFSITRVDNNLNLHCNTYLGHDDYYRIYGIRASLDGGVIVYGSKSNSPLNPYILKVGPDCDLPFTSILDPDAGPIPISLYPNPGRNTISVSTDGLDSSLLTFELFNMQGKKLFMKQDLSSDIVVPDYPAGPYVYRIIQGEQLLSTGNWLKL